MDIVYNAVKLAAELSKYGEVIAGNSRERQLVEVIRGYIENYIDDLRIEPVEVLSWGEELCLIYIDGTPYQCSVHPPYDNYINIDTDSNNIIYVRDLKEINRLSKNIEGKLVVVNDVGDPNYVAIYSYILRKYKPLAIVFVDRLDTLRRIVSIDDLLARYEYVPPPVVPSIHVGCSVGLKLRSASSVQITAKSRLRPSYGYNIIARVNGRDAGTIYLTAHHDHWFNGVVDDLLGVSILISLARTQVLQYLARSSIVLAFFTAEEGLPNPLVSFYWLVGSREHVASNARRLLEEVLLAVNLDVIHGSKIRYATSNLLVRGLLMKLGVDINDIDHDSMLYDSYVFTALGLPSITLHNYPEVLGSGLYHSTLDDIKVVDVGFINAVLYSLMLLLRNSHSLLRLQQKELLDLGLKTLVYELTLKIAPIEVVLSLHKVIRRLKSCDNISALSRITPLLHRIITTTYVSKSIYRGEDIYEKTSYIACGKEQILLPLAQELDDECYENILHNLESLIYILRC